MLVSSQTTARAMMNTFCGFHHCMLLPAYFSLHMQRFQVLQLWHAQAA
jgi:hypothetical protein